MQNVVICSMNVCGFVGIVFVCKSFHVHLGFMEVLSLYFNNFSSLHFVSH